MVLRPRSIDVFNKRFFPLTQGNTHALSAVACIHATPHRQRRGRDPSANDCSCCAGQALADGVYFTMLVIEPTALVIMLSIDEVISCTALIIFFRISMGSTPPPPPCSPSALPGPFERSISG